MTISKVEVSLGKQNNITISDLEPVINIRDIQSIGRVFIGSGEDGDYMFFPFFQVKITKKEGIIRVGRYRNNQGTIVRCGSHNDQPISFELNCRHKPPCTITIHRR